jgi:four helix bundle protein
MGETSNVKRQGGARSVGASVPDLSEWERSVPAEITGDSLWKMAAYRLALFASDLGWDDVTVLAADPRTRGLSDQLYRALGSISANLAEGYSRGTGRDRARFYEYALGSARETRDWYYKGRHVLGSETAAHRLQLLTRITKLLLAMVPQQRSDLIRDGDQPTYEVSGGSWTEQTEEI